MKWPSILPLTLSHFLFCIFFVGDLISPMALLPYGGNFQTLVEGRLTTGDPVALFTLSDKKQIHSLNSIQGTQVLSAWTTPLSHWQPSLTLFLLLALFSPLKNTVFESWVPGHNVPSWSCPSIPGDNESLITQALCWVGPLPVVLACRGICRSQLLHDFYLLLRFATWAPDVYILSTWPLLVNVP